MIDGYSLQPSLFDEVSFFCEASNRDNVLVLYFRTGYSCLLK